MTLEGIKISGKQLKVNNWAGFLLSKLQLLYAKGDCCDLTLKFHSGEELKVHKLILKTCTSYFTLTSVANEVIMVPESLPYMPVHTIVRFLYSGLLEFKSEDYELLMSAAKTLDITFLVKLLSNHNLDDVKVDSKAPVNKNASFPQPNKRTVISNPIPSLLQSSPVNMLNTKKLPIWRKRAVIRASAPVNIIDSEDPKPARFEWPGEEDESTSILIATPSFTSISYESQPLMKPAVDSSALSSASSQIPDKREIKKRVMPPINHNPTNSSENSGSPSTNQDQTKLVEEVSDDDDDGHFETIHNYDHSDDDTPQDPDPPPLTPQPPRPILKPASDTPGPTPAKKVRFLFSPEDKIVERGEKDTSTQKPVTENPTGTHSSLSDEQTLPVTTSSSSLKPSIQTVTAPSSTLEESEKGENINSSHAKIIAEVLKKFPDLVRNNKNIKLKISAANSISPLSINRNNNDKNKASYVVVKSSPHDKMDSPPVIINPATSESPAENTSGPWFCKKCKDASGSDLQFPSYFNFRKHLQNVHNEKLDSRMCDYCGHRSTKRNLQLYHLYTKHNIKPPKSVKFPRCSECNYVALTQSLLAKHTASHQGALVQCGMCQISFKGMDSYQAHAVTCKGDFETKGFYCKICKKNFTTTATRVAHAKVCQGGKTDTTMYQEEDEDDPGVEMIEVPVLGLDKTGHTLVQLPPGLVLADPPNMTLIPSPENPELNTVASSITSSIGLTVQLPEDQAVILLDGNSEFFLQGNEPMVVSNSAQMQEFIVPDMLDGEMRHLYSTSTTVPYSVSNVIPYSSVVQLQTSTPTVNTVSIAGRVSTLAEPLPHIQSSVEGLSHLPATIIDNVGTTKGLISSSPSPQEGTVCGSTVKPYSSNMSIMVVNTGDPPSQVASEETSQVLTKPNSVQPESVLKELPSTNLRKSTEIKDDTITAEVDRSEGDSASGVSNNSKKSGVKGPNLIEVWDMDDDENNCDAIDDPELKPIRASLR